MPTPPAYVPPPSLPPIPQDIPWIDGNPTGMESLMINATRNNFMDAIRKALELGRTIKQQAQAIYGNRNSGSGGYYTPTAQSSGGPSAPPPVTWSEGYDIEGAPEFWKGMLPSRWTAESEYATLMNAIVPFLSEEDQRQMASSLSRLYGADTAFGNYSPETVDFGEPTEDLSKEQQQYFMSAKRAEGILSALDTVQEASGRDNDEFGPGYQYLRQIADAMRDFGAQEGFERQSRRQQLNMYGTLDPLLAEAKGEQLGAYGEMARAMTQPFFSGDTLMQVRQTEDGRWVFGSPNTKWY